MRLMGFKMGLMSIFSDLIEDSKMLEKRVEKEKISDPMWQSFLSNPACFQVSSKIFKVFRRDNRILCDNYSNFFAAVKSRRY